MNFDPNQFEIHECIFEANIEELEVKIHFPSLVYVTFGVSKSSPPMKLNNNRVTVQEILKQKAEIPYDKINKKYLHQ